MARNLTKSKNRTESGPFIAVPKLILESPEYAALSAYAVKLLLDLFAQFNGKNNGDFCATWSVMKKRGWKSKDTLEQKLKELLASGFIKQTRQGEKGNHSGTTKPSLFAVTWLRIDECKNKLDIKPIGSPLNSWKRK